MNKQLREQKPRLTYSRNSSSDKQGHNKSQLRKWTSREPRDQPCLSLHPQIKSLVNLKSTCLLCKLKLCSNRWHTISHHNNSKINLFSSISSQQRLWDLLLQGRPRAHFQQDQELSHHPDPKQDHSFLIKTFNKCLLNRWTCSKCQWSNKVKET